jgi:hypothetical protein
LEIKLAVWKSVRIVVRVWWGGGRVRARSERVSSGREVVRER